MSDAPYRLIRPATRLTSVVFASPHSGRAYPASFLARSVLDKRTIRTSEDAFVDELLRAAPLAGAPLLAATAPRAYLDLNRAADELDPALIENVRLAAHNPRINSGLGVIPRVVAGGRAIYRGKLTLAEAMERIDAVWRPYHERLAALLGESQALFGEAILIDVHSMPREAIDSMGGRGRRRPEIVLGDRFGLTAAPGIMDRIEAAFADEGLSVVRNTPFAGAYVAQTYGRPAASRHAIQVEIDRSLYMNEAEIRPHAGFAPFCRLMDRVIGRIAEIGRPEIGRPEIGLAAE